MAQMSIDEKYIYMTQTPVQKLICRLALPSTISMLITTFYNMADTFFVGKLDTSSVGAVGVAFSAMAVIQAIGFMFGNGSGSYMSRQLGRRQKDEAEKTASTGFITAMAIGVLLAVLGLIFIEPLAVALGSTDTILPYAIEYLRVILFAAPFYIGSITINCQLKMQGSASVAMIGIVSGGVLNLFLDPLLIFVFDLGVFGAALATGIGQAVSFFILLLVVIRGKNVKIRFRSFSPSLHRYGKLLAGGVPSLCRQGITSVAAIMLNHAAGIYGDAAIAGMTITNRVIMFANSALIGFGQGFQPVCAYNYSARLFKRVKDGFWFCVKYGFWFLLGVAVVLFIFAPDVAALFRKGDDEVIAIASSALRWQILIFPLNTWVVMVNMMLQTEGKALRASIMAVCRQGVFFIPFINILPYFFELRGVVMCQLWSDVFTFIVALFIGLRALRELREPPASPPDGKPPADFAENPPLDTLE